MDKSNKELALELLAAHITGRLAAGSYEPSTSDLRQQYKEYLEFVKNLPG